MKKKYIATSQDKRDWDQFIKEIANIQDKDADLDNENIRKSKIRKLDLHGFSLVEANKAVKKFIFESIKYGYKKILIVTGKGIRSKVEENPYISKELGILKNSIPEFIKNNNDLFNKIKKMESGDSKRGGIGVLYILLK